MATQTKKRIVLQESHIKLYRFVEKFTKRRIVAPLITEIAKGIELTERQTYRLVDDMVALGYLKRTPYQRRSIVIAKELT